VLTLPTTVGRHDLAPMLENADGLWGHHLHGDLPVQ
jgi:hypothetical protein